MEHKVIAVVFHQHGFIEVHVCGGATDTSVCKVDVQDAVVHGELAQRIDEVGIEAHGAIAEGEPAHFGTVARMLGFIAGIAVSHLACRQRLLGNSACSMAVDIALYVASKPFHGIESTEGDAEAYAGYAFCLLRHCNIVAEEHVARGKNKIGLTHIEKVTDLVTSIAQEDIDAYRVIIYFVHIGGQHLAFESVETYALPLAETIGV